MKILKKAAVLLLLLPIITVSSCAMNNQTNHAMEQTPIAVTMDESGIHRTTRFGNVEFTITTGRENYVIGDRISILVKATNIGRKTIYTHDGTTSYDANGLHLRLGSVEHEFYFCDNLKNVAVNAAIYSGELKPGETITMERIVDTADISYSENNWKPDYIENLPAISVVVTLYHTQSPHEGFNAPYTCSIPLNIVSKSVDQNLKELLFSKYDINLATKLLLSEDSEEIYVWIWFDDYDTAKKTIEDHFPDRMDIIEYVEKSPATAVVELTRHELIKMAENGFGIEISLY